MEVVLDPTQDQAVVHAAFTSADISPALVEQILSSLEEIAARVAQRQACLRVTGHASVTGASIANDRLSLARAQAVRATLVRNAPPLRDRSEAIGRGSREPIVGLGTDDMRDALDRRVEFAPRHCQA